MNGPYLTNAEQLLHDLLDECIDEDAEYAFCRRLVAQGEEEGFAADVIAAAAARLGPTREYRVPPVFYWDHVQRDCAAGRVVRETRSHVFVELDGPAYDDLLSDARYYSDASQFEGEYLGLCSSARATRRALEAAGRPS